MASRTENEEIERSRNNKAPAPPNKGGAGDVVCQQRDYSNTYR